MKRLLPFLAAASLFFAPSAFAASVRVELAPSRALSHFVMRGSSVSMMPLRFRASCGAVSTVKSITLVHEGDGDTSDIAGLTLVSGGQSLSNTAVINPRSRTATLTFSPALTIASCGTVQMDVIADVSPTASVGGMHGFLLEFQTDVLGDDTDAGGLFPLRGRSFQVNGPPHTGRECLRQAHDLTAARARIAARAECRKQRR